MVSCRIEGGHVSVIRLHSDGKMSRKNIVIRSNERRSCAAQNRNPGPTQALSHILRSHISSAGPARIIVCDNFYSLRFDISMGPWGPDW